MRIKNEHRTSNVQHRILQRRTSVEWKKMKELNYDRKERLLEYSVRIIKNDILEETRELITIFVTSIKKELKLRSGVTSLFDVQSVRPARNALIPV